MNRQDNCMRAQTSRLNKLAVNLHMCAYINTYGNITKYIYVYVNMHRQDSSGRVDTSRQKKLAVYSDMRAYIHTYVNIYICTSIWTAQQLLQHSDIEAEEVGSEFRYAGIHTYMCTSIWTAQQLLNNSEIEQRKLAVGINMCAYIHTNKNAYMYTCKWTGAISRQENSAVRIDMYRTYIYTDLND